MWINSPNTIQAMTQQNSQQRRMDPELMHQYNLNAMNNSNYRTYIEENKSDVKPEHYVINTTHTDEKFEVIRED
jgi:hypothetical protein